MAATSANDLDLSGVPSGAYVLQVICDDGAYTKRLLIER
jgi:hypothetical protein